MSGAAVAERVLLLGVTLAACRTAIAQATLTLDTRATTVKYDGFDRSHGFSVAPSFRWERRSAFVSASADFARFGGGASAFGEVLGSWFSGPWRDGTMRLEVGGTASTSAYRNAVRNTFLLAHGRVHLSNDDRGGWLGGGTGYLSHTSAYGTMASADAGAWTRIASAMLSLHVAAAHFPRANPVVPPDLSPVLGDNATALLGWSSSGGYETRTDATASLHVPFARAELEALAGTRLAGHTGSHRQWGSIAGSYWLTRNVAVVARAGTYPSRIERGFPSASFASLALRLASRPRSERFVFVAPRSRATSLNVRWQGPDTATLRVTAPGASRVELRGDFTDWRPVPMSQTGANVWEITLPLTPGSYRATLRIDGSVWAPPPGTQGLEDEFGEFVGIIVIGEP